MTVLDEIKKALMDGSMNGVRDGVYRALDAGLTPVAVIDGGLIAAMDVIGARFKNNEIFMPEVLVAARAMHAGMNILKPLLAGNVIEEKGAMVIGTVKGDLHDIGKNMVMMMMEGAGFKVVDLGVDVPAAKFVQAVEEHRPDVVGMSALLTATMLEMVNIVACLADCRPRVKVIVGGAAVTQRFAAEIGADGYAADAASAVDVVRSLLQP